MKKYILSFFFGMIFCLVILVTLALNSEYPQEIGHINFTVSSYNPFQNVNSLTECNELDLINTSYCFADYVNSFYNYTHDRIEIENHNGTFFIIDYTHYPSFSKVYLLNDSFENYLREHGGICSEWSLYYNELCQRTNFRCQIVSNEGIEDVFPGHQYFVMYNETNYCKLDGINVYCGNNWISWY